MICWQADAKIIEINSMETTFDNKLDILAVSVGPPPRDCGK